MAKRAQGRGHRLERAALFENQRLALDEQHRQGDRLLRGKLPVDHSHDRLGDLGGDRRAAGGATIPAQVAKAIVGVIDWKLSAQEAIALPVLFVQGEALVLEQGSTLEAMAPALRALGHEAVTSRPMPLKANAAEVIGKRLIGAADPRSEGRPITE